MKICGGVRALALMMMMMMAPLFQAGCGSGGGGESERAHLRGRVFSAGSGRGLEGATVKLAGSAANAGIQVETDEEGRFELDYAPAPAQRLSVSGAHHATVYESAPEAGGYMEMFAVPVEVEKTIDVSKGAKLYTPGGLAVVVEPGALKHLDGSPAEKAKVQISRVDVKKSAELLALPGNLDVEVDGKRGKLLLKDAFYVSASEKGKPLKGKVKAGFLPDGLKQATPEPNWFFFPITSIVKDPLFEAIPSDFRLTTVQIIGPYGGVNVEAGSFNVEGPTYVAVGAASTDLGCARTCVEDVNGEPAANVELTATTETPAISGSAHTDAEGCVAVELPSAIPSPVKVRVAGEQGSWEGEVALAPAGSISDPASCQALPNIMLKGGSDSACPAGYLVCGERCLDPFSYDSCSDVVGEEPLDAGAPQEDAGGEEPQLDAGVPEEDAGGEEPILDASAGQDATTPDQDAGVADAGAGGGDAGSDGGTSVAVIYVNTELGQAGNPGTIDAPLRTITEALAAVPNGTAAQIFVAPGTYSGLNGETFPLIIPDRVELMPDPATQGTVRISGGGSYQSSHALDEVITAVVLSGQASLLGVTVVTAPDPSAYAVTIDGSATLVNNVFEGENGVRVLWDSPWLYYNRFEVSGNGLSGCKAGSLDTNTFVGGMVQVDVFGDDLCFINNNTFSGGGIVGLWVSNEGSASLYNSTFIHAEGYSLAAIRVDGGGQLSLRYNDFTGIGAGTILETGLEQTVDVELGTELDPGANTFPGDEAFAGVRLKHDANADIDAYGNDWGDGRASPTCDSDIQRSESAANGYSVNAEVVCSW